MTSPNTSAEFRHWLSQLSQAQLRTLLEHRVDATHPTPPSLGSLAARLLLRNSLQLALQRQDALGLAVLQAAGSIRTGGNIEPLDAPKVVEELARHTGTATTGTATTGTCISETEVLKRIQTLLEYGLCFGEPSAFHPVAEALQALPSGLDLLEATDDALPPKLEELDAASRRILETLHHSGGVGTTRDAASDADPSKPIPRLIAAGLLKRVDSNTVVLPLRVRALLSGRRMPQIPLHPPATHLDATLEVDTGQSLEVLRQLTSVIEALGEHPIPLLKSGDVGLRSVTQLAKKIDVEERDVVRLISIARAAFLLSIGIPEPYPSEEEGASDNNYLAPTTLAGVFQDAALHVQWAWVLHCWWNRATVRTWAVRTSAAPNTPNTTNTTNSVRLLSPESISEQLPALRRTIIAGARQAPGSVGTLFRFQNPLLSLRVEEALLEGVLGEARWLGVLSTENGPTDVLDVLRAAPIAALQKDLEALLPADLVAFTQRHTPGIVEQLVPQGDMTVLAPGPLPPALAQSLALIAERESMGIATLYRLSAASIRRGLDAGMSSQEILGVLEQHTLGEVPSSMRYLIEAESKQHGQVRGGVALSYITSQDPSTITALCNSPAAETTGLQQLAPTVAVAQVPLLQVIRAAAQTGVHVVAQDSHGASITMRPTPSVVPTPRPSSSSDKHARAEQSVERAVQALLADRERTDATSSARNLSRSQTPLEALQEAIRTQRSVKLGFVDRSGAASFAKVTPIALASGQLSALNEATGAVEHFLLHRITEVSFA